MGDFSEEILAKIKSIKNLLSAGIDPLAMKVKIGDASNDATSLIQNIEKIKRDVSLIDFKGPFNRNPPIIKTEPSRHSESVNEPTKHLEKNDLKSWQDLRRFVEITKRARFQDGEKRTYKCTICGYQEQHSASQMQDHVESEHFKGNFKYNCSLCEKQFLTRRTVKRHEGKVHASKKQPFRSSTSDLPDDGLKSADVINPDSDDTNPDCVRVWDDLKKFISVKEKGRSGRNGKRSTLECSICEYPSPQRSHLLNHIERQHFKGTFAYTCLICGISPSTRHGLECHMREKHNKNRGDWNAQDVVTTNGNKDLI